MKRENLVQLSNELTEVEFYHFKSPLHWPFVRRRLTLETYAFQIFRCGNSTFINSFDKAKFSFLQQSCTSS